jgi:hypothetical protein
MKPSLTFPRTPDDYSKWSDQHRTQVWEMIERLGKGQVSCKEAREILSEERKALMAAGRQLLGFKASRGLAPDSARLEMGGAPKKRKSRRTTPTQNSAQPPTMG